MRKGEGKRKGKGARAFREGRKEKEEDSVSRLDLY